MTWIHYQCHQQTHEIQVLDAQVQRAPAGMWESSRVYPPVTKLAHVRLAFGFHPVYVLIEIEMHHQTY